MCNNHLWFTEQAGKMSFNPFPIKISKSLIGFYKVIFQIPSPEKGTLFFFFFDEFINQGQKKAGKPRQRRCLNGALKQKSLYPSKTWNSSRRVVFTLYTTRNIFCLSLSFCIFPILPYLQYSLIPSFFNHFPSLQFLPILIDISSSS